MANRPTVIANQTPREIQVDPTGRRASAPAGYEPQGDVRQVGTANNAVPDQQHRQADRMVAAVAAPELLAAVVKAKEEPTKATTVVRGALPTTSRNFSARLQHLKEQNAALKKQMTSLDRKPGVAEVAVPNAQSRIKAILARRTVT